MLKRIIITLYILCIIHPVFADITPYKISDIPLGTIGVYQTGTNLQLYLSAEKKSPKTYEKNWSYLAVSSSDFAEQLFAVLLSKKELSFLYVTDIDEDFVQVLYNKNKKLTGWAQKEDEFQFLPWITFMNMYGKKYGLKILKDTPVEIKELHTKSNPDSQTITKIIHPKTIRLTTIQGNWALVTVLDCDNITKTGFMRWRGDNGEIYLFPAIQ